MSQQRIKYNGRSYRIRNMYNRGQQTQVFWSSYTPQDHARTLAISKGQKPYPTIEYLGKRQRVYTHSVLHKCWPLTESTAARNDQLKEGDQYFYSNYTPDDHAKFLSGSLTMDLWKNKFTKKLKNKNRPWPFLREVVLTRWITRETNAHLVIVTRIPNRKRLLQRNQRITEGIKLNVTQCRPWLQNFQEP